MIEGQELRRTYKQAKQKSLQAKFALWTRSRFGKFHRSSELEETTENMYFNQECQNKTESTDLGSSPDFYA